MISTVCRQKKKSRFSANYVWMLSDCNNDEQKKEIKLLVWTEDEEKRERDGEQKKKPNSSGNFHSSSLNVLQMTRVFNVPINQMLPLLYIWTHHLSWLLLGCICTSKRFHPLCKNGHKHTVGQKSGRERESEKKQSLK